MADFRDELIKLTNPAPIFKDPEDFSDDDTAAKLTIQDEKHSLVESHISRLRQKTAIILSETDNRYAGKQTSRKHLDSEDGSVDDMDYQDDMDEDSDNEDEEEDGGSDESSNIDDEDMSSFSKKISSISKSELTFVDDGDYSKYADDDESMDDDDESLDDDEEETEELDDDEEEEDGDVDEDKEDSEFISTGEDAADDGIQKFSSAAGDDVAKGQAARQQLGLWDSLLEGRIKLQKAVSLINQLPQTDVWEGYVKSSTEFTTEASKTQKVFSHLLESLIYLQDLLLAQNRETQALVNSGQAQGVATQRNAKTADVGAVAAVDDEEIPSDSDGEMAAEANPRPPVRLGKRKLTLGEYPVALKKHHQAFTSYRNQTIQKWYDKTRLASGKVKGKSFSSFDQSALAQINQILGDKERLVRRSQMKRSVYRVLGKAPKPDQAEQVPSEELAEQPDVSNDNLKDYDAEVFDDDDFYHQMLRELIEKKTSDVNDPVALSRQWLEIQKLRSKNKKKVDTKASKGRKVRYNVHKKLVNFMAPIDNCEWTQEARDDLFKSLFGSRFTNSNGV